MSGVALMWGAVYPVSENTFNFETASTALMREDARHLVFLRDNPTTPNESSMRGVAGFFFMRAGKPVSVDVVNLKPGEDPNAALLVRAVAPRTAILWIYDEAINGTAGLIHPPVIARIDPRWRCADYGCLRFKVIACSRKT